MDYDEKTYPCNSETKFDEWEKDQDNLGLDFPNVSICICTYNEICMFIVSNNNRYL